MTHVAAWTDECIRQRVRLPFAKEPDNQVFCSVPALSGFVCAQKTLFSFPFLKEEFHYG